MATRKSDSIFTHLLRCIFVANLFLSVLSTGVPGPCSSLSSLEIKVDWWSILPYSTGEKQKDGNYTYTGKTLLSFADDNDFPINDFHVFLFLCRIVEKISKTFYAVHMTKLSTTLQ